jgi:carbon monoxide dehydrogenase subunit G
VFQVQAPVSEVWSFVMDPHQVVACMPGAQLDEVIDGQTFHGTISVKVGAVTTTYRGRVTFVRVDEAERAVEMAAEGRETGGGTAKGTMSSRLAANGHGTEVTVEASVDVTGRIAQMGRGMIQGVSEQLFAQFVACAKAKLESPEGAEQSAAVTRAAQPIAILPLLLRTLAAAIARFFRTLFRRSPSA